jgi:membrane-bound lytic murein transglycosylase D
MRIARQAGCFLALAAVAVGQTPAAAPPAPPPDAADLFRIGKQLFDQLAPDEIKAQYDFPSKEQWDAFAARLQHALESEDLSALAGYADEGRAALTALRTIPGYDDYADWLEQRLDEISVAREATAPPGPTAKPLPKPTAGAVPYYELWRARVKSRPWPVRAAALMPRLRSAFAAEGVPPELAWIAEAESSLNPAARSPAGAKGLFQFMPDTAKGLGLSTFLPDDRSDPEKSAHAAARYLKTLHGRFGSWPLALAAYNAGEGRVARELTARHARDFAGIAGSLPAETRMYVPKVLALVSERAGVAPDKISPPRTE